MSTDIVVIGGGIIGSSIAYFLSRSGSGARVVVVEPDPTYACSATLRASGGIRRLFSLPENIEMSKYSLDFYLDFEAHVGIPGEDRADVLFKKQGYLFIVPPSAVGALEASHKTQVAHGVNAQILDAAALGSRYPSMNVSDLGAAVLSPDDGCFDPNSALQGFRRRARAQGVTYLKRRVVGLALAGNRVGEVRLDEGTTLHPEAVVNAAGTWSAQVCEMIGMPLPVEPMRRMDHFFDCGQAIEPLPFIKDVHGLGFHPEGSGYTGSVVDHAAPGGHNFEPDHGYFERVVWPHLAERFPAFEGLKERSTWAAHYDRNTLDGNMILGNWPGRAENFYVAAGFSGHGLMHAPAVGLAMSELVLSGKYQTLDLARMDYRRVLRAQRYAEAGIR